MFLQWWPLCGAEIVLLCAVVLRKDIPQIQSLQQKPHFMQ